MTDDEIDDIIERWHGGEWPDKELHEALGWTWEQYSTWLEDPNAVPGRR